MATEKLTIGVTGDSTVYHPTTTAPFWNYPTYYYGANEDARFRFALELIATAQTLAEAKRLAKAALRQRD